MAARSNSVKEVDICFDLEDGARQRKNVRDSDESSDSDEEERSGVEQEFSVDAKTMPLQPVVLSELLQPNLLIVKLEGTGRSTVLSASMQVALASCFHQNRPTQEAPKRGHKLWSKHAAVVVDSMMVIDSFGKEVWVSDCEDSDVEDDIDSTQIFVRGTILASSSDSCEVFLCDLGQVRKCSPLGISRLTDDKLLSVAPAYAMVTIPGLVPRKRYDHIPGLSGINCQDTQWSQEARMNVNYWLSKYRVILCRILKKETNDVWYGDFYGSSSSRPCEVRTETSLSSYLVEQKNAFFNYQRLGEINNI